MKQSLLRTTLRIAGVSAIALLTALTAGAKGTQWDIDGKIYNVDTLRHVSIGPGITQTSLSTTGSQTLRIHYVTVDLTNPYNDVRVTKANNKYSGLSRLSAQQAAADAPGARYLAGVNADFFGNNAPIGSCIVDGKIICANSNTWDNWYMTADKRPHYGQLGYKGTATFPDSSTHAVNGINTYRNENHLTIYDKNYNGTNSGTNKYGQEVSIEPIEGKLSFTGAMKVRVTGEVDGAGSMAIPDGGYVLSGHGDAATLIQNLKVGDVVNIELYPELSETAITQMASGKPMILSEGKILNTESALDHLTALNPRTAVGNNADGTKLVLLVVDGRWSGFSVGVVSRILAGIMSNVGCTEAMNFDGGGSSELYTKQFGVVNHPSDGNERTVTNAAWAVSTAPDDDVIASIAFDRQSITVPKYGYYTPTVYGYNKYGMLVSTDVKVTVSAPAELGEAINDGSTLFAKGHGTHALTATYGDGITTTMCVTVGSGKPAARLTEVVVDSFRDYVAEVNASVDEVEMPVANRALSWSSADAAIATVDADGCIHGVSNGETTITGTVDGNEVSILAKVQIPTRRWTKVDPERDLTKWTVSKTALSAASVKAVEGDPEAFDINYTVQSTRGTKVTVKMASQLFALPDSIRLAFTPGQAKINKVTVEGIGKGLRGVTYTLDKAYTGTEAVVIDVPVKEFFDNTDLANYPMTLNSIGFFLGDAVKANRTIRVNSLYAVHTALDYSTNSGVENIIAPDAAADSDQPVRYYNLQGQPVNAATAAPGLYLRRQGSRSTKVIIR